MGRPFIPCIQIINSDGEEEEITREDQLTRDLLTVWEVAVEQYVQREARERTVPESTVCDELSVPPTVHDLLGKIPRLLARNLVHIEDERMKEHKSRGKEEGNKFFNGIGERAESQGRGTQ